jgi:hypothetical protein
MEERLIIMNETASPFEHRHNGVAADRLPAGNRGCRRAAALAGSRAGFRSCQKGSTVLLEPPAGRAEVLRSSGGIKAVGGQSFRKLSST